MIHFYALDFNYVSLCRSDVSFDAQCMINFDAVDF